MGWAMDSASATVSVAAVFGRWSAWIEHDRED